MAWAPDEILAKLKQLHKAGKDISYNALSKTMQPLVSAAAYHFGTYRDAIEKAGIDYLDVSRRPRWSRDRVIEVIRKAHKDGEELNWASVTARRDDVGRAAFASLQKRLFGSWDQALVAAGLVANDIARYRNWDKESIAAAIRERGDASAEVSSGVMQKSDPGLHAAAIRYFGCYDAALIAAGIDPLKVRIRRAWTKARAIQELKDLQKLGNALSGTDVRRAAPTLYGASVRLFGSFGEARKAAGIKVKVLVKK
jgi:hypothetical protein